MDRKEPSGKQEGQSQGFRSRPDERGWRARLSPGWTWTLEGNAGADLLADLGGGSCDFHFVVFNSSFSCSFLFMIRSVSFTPGPQIQENIGTYCIWGRRSESGVATQVGAVQAEEPFFLK